MSCNCIGYALASVWWDNDQNVRIFIDAKLGLPTTKLTSVVIDINFLFPFRVTPIQFHKIECALSALLDFQYPIGPHQLLVALLNGGLVFSMPGHR